MEQKVKLGMEIQKISSSYSFKDVVKFLKGELEYCMHFDMLKPLYDEFGYKEVNELILEIADLQVKEQRPLNNNGVETR